MSERYIDFSKVCMNPSEVEYVIYHHNCPDGFGSALCCHKYFKDLNMPQPIYYSGKYGDIPSIDDIMHKNVLICDFSYKKDIIQKLLSVVKKLLILDHHKTAQEDLKDVPDSNKVFIMNHSASYITWMYFFRDTPIPRGILYIEDNDIWKKELQYTNEFTAFLTLLPFTFDAYDKILDDNYILQEVIPQGSILIKKNNIVINNTIKYASPKFIQINDKYYFVAHLNSTSLKSELGNKVFTEYPNINFSAIYSHNDYNNSTTFSLRSIDTATDVSDIAKIYNGGGHRNASGMACNYITNTIPAIIIDNHITYFLLNNIYIISHVIDGIVYDTVYLNSSHYKDQLSKYLLQTRYTIKDQDIQECTSIMMKRNKKNGEVKISIIWNYDGINDCTWYTIYTKDRILKIKLINLLKRYDNFTENDDTIVCSYKSIYDIILKKIE